MICLFSITHSGFNPKIISHIADIIHPRHCIYKAISYFLSEIHLKFVMEFLVLIYLIGRWSVLLVGGRVVGGSNMGLSKSAFLTHFGGN